MERRIARFATSLVADARVPISLTEGVATAEPADAPVDLGGAIGNFRVPSADLTHADAVACGRVTSSRPSSGGNQSGGATEVLFVSGRAAAVVIGHRDHGFATVRA